MIRLLTLAMMLPLALDAQTIWATRCRTARIGGNTVNLAPLCFWWTNSPNRLDTRPLSSWVRVTGQIERVNGSEWLVRGRVWSQPGDAMDLTFIVINAPEQERERHDGLQQVEQSVQARISGIAGQAALSGPGNWAEVYERRADILRYAGPDAQAGYQANAAAAQQRRAIDAAAQSRIAQVGAYSRAVQDQLAALPFPRQAYQCDLFVLWGDTYRGATPIFNAGQLGR
jgi:hypothetical protein